MMRTICLHGSLGEKFGKSYRFDINIPTEAGRALCQLPGFLDYVRERHYHLVRGDLMTGLELGVEDLSLGLGSATELHIIPYLEGAGGRGGLGKMIVGALLVAVAIAGSVMTGGLGTPVFAGMASLTYGTVLMAGVSMLFAGVSQMIAARSKSNYGNRDRPQDQNSFLFNGPSNVTEQGNPIPLVYGRVLTGSLTVSAGIWTEKYVPDGT